MNFEKPAVLKLPIVLREIEVARAQSISPTLRRIWFRGEQLQAFSKDGRDLPPFRSEGPEDHVKFFFPSPVDGTLSLPVQADGTIDWPKDPRPVARDYTPRGYREGDEEVAFDFVLHGHGIASTWAATAEPGDRLHMAGPKASLLIPGASHFVLIADQTALPALANWLERLPETVRVEAVVWIDDEASRIALETRASANIVWIVDPSPEGEKLLDALKSLPVPDGDSFVWGAMEAGVLRKVRSHYIDTCGLDRGQIDMAAYWRRGVDDDQLLAQAFRLRELTDLQKPYAIRAAVQFRLPELVAEGVDDVAGLARRAGVDAEALSRLMPIYLECGIFKLNGNKITLGLTGDLLTSPYRRNMLSPDTAQGRMHLSAQGMAHFLKTGQSAYKATFGTAIEDDAASDATIGEGLGHDLGHMVEALTAQTLGPLATACGATIATLGTGAEAVLMSLLKLRKDVTGTAIVADWALEEAREHLNEAGFGDRAAVCQLGAQIPEVETLIICAIGERWSDAVIESVVAAQQADDTWLIEMASRPESVEIAEDAMLLDIGFGMRRGHATELAENLAEYGLEKLQTLSTRTGLRLTRFGIGPA